MPAVIMPKMGDAMEEVTLLKWLKNEGDTVAEGDAIAEIETDKVTLELTAENAGTLARRIAQEGQSVPVGQPIAMIAGEGESRYGGGEPQAAGTSDLAQIQGSGPGGRIVREDVEAVLRQRREGGAAAPSVAPPEAEPAQPAAPAAPTAPAAPRDGVESVPLTR